jgi:hypothetical protein
MDQPGNLLEVNAVMWSSDVIHHDVLMPVIAERMVARFPRFSRRPGDTRVPHLQGRWVDDERFDLGRHVRQVELDAPGDRAALQDYVAGQVGIPLDPGRPLWEVHVVRGAGLGGAALIRVHHALADGISLMRLMLSLTDGGPTDAFRDPRDPGPLGELVRSGLSAVSHGVQLLRHPGRVPDAISTGLHDAARLVHLATLPHTPESVLSGEVGVRKLVT